MITLRQLGTRKAKGTRRPATFSALRLWPVAVLLLVLAPLAQGPARAAEDNPSPPSVILISVDTLRADHLSCYGYHAHRTPHLDALAVSGTLFTQISSQVPLTLPSHTSLLTSTYPFWNGVNENGEVVKPGMVTLPGILRSHSYKTAAFIGGYFLARRFGLDQGFEVYDSPFGAAQGSLAKALDLKRPAGTVIGSAEKWLEQNTSHPYFAFIHLFDLHMPYNPPARWHRAFKGDDYDAELAYVDATLGSFCAFLKAHGLYDRTLIVLTSDHGESLGEHGESTHGYFTYQSTLHVPLIIHWPADGAPRPAKVQSPAGLIDVAPTILQSLNVPLPPSFQGHSLLDELRTDLTQADQPVYSESLYAHDNFGCKPLRSLRLGEYQYISAPRAELYDLRSDPRELKNLVRQQSARAKSLQEELEGFLGTHGVKAPEPPKQVSRADTANLRSLGYLALSDPRTASEDSGADPKDRLMEYRGYLRGLRLAQTGRLAEAEAAFEAILDEDPACAGAHYELASCLYQQRRFYDAVSHLKDALALNSRDIPAEELLGTVWLEAQDCKQARAEFTHLLTMSPDDYTAHYGLAVIDDLELSLDDAAREYRAALQARPDAAEAHLGLGKVYLRQEKLPEALEEFQEVTVLAPRSAESFYQMGLALQGEGRRPEAAKAFRQALRLSPDFHAAQAALKALPTSQR